MVLEGKLSELCNSAKSDLCVFVDNPQKALESLNQQLNLQFDHNFEIVLTNDGLQVNNIELTETPIIHRILVNSGIRVFQSRYDTPSLETIFHQQHKD